MGHAARVISLLLLLLLLRSTSTDASQPTQQSLNIRRRRCGGGGRSRTRQRNRQQTATSSPTIHSSGTRPFTHSLADIEMATYMRTSRSATAAATVVTWIASESTTTTAAAAAFGRGCRCHRNAAAGDVACRLRYCHTTPVTVVVVACGKPTRLAQLRTRPRVRCCRALPAQEQLQARIKSASQSHSLVNRLREPNDEYDVRRNGCRPVDRTVSLS